MIEDKNGLTYSGIRFEKGEQKCGICKTEENIIQFERYIKRKGLPITEIAFLCRICAEKNNLIKNSLEIIPKEDVPKYIAEQGAICNKGMCPYVPCRDYPMCEHVKKAL